MQGHLNTKAQRRGDAEESRSARGYTLVETLVYMAVFMVIMGLTMSAYYRVETQSRHLKRNADDIARALQAGERWREDVRQAKASPRLVQEQPHPVLEIPGATGAVRYEFRENAVWRVAGSNNLRTCLLPAVKSSRMEPDARQKVRAWRWELELAGAQKVARVKPLFTFESVPTSGKQP